MSDLTPRDLAAIKDAEDRLSARPNKPEWTKVEPWQLDVFLAALEMLESGAPGIKETLRVHLANRIAMRAGESFRGPRRVEAQS